MVIYLVRHGETHWNHLGKIQGQSDISLNEAGIRMAQAAAERLKDVSFDRVFSSPLLRARQTAEILADGRGVAVETDERLKEMSFGCEEGAAVDRICENPQDPMYRFFRDPEHFCPPEGAESFEQLYERTGAFMRDVLLPLEKTCRYVLVTAHAAVNHSIINAVAGIPLSEFWKIRIGNCEAMKIILEGGNFHLEASEGV